MLGKRMGRPFDKVFDTAPGAVHADLAVVVDLQRNQEEMRMFARKQLFAQRPFLPAVDLLAVRRPHPLCEFVQAKRLVMAIVGITASAHHSASKVPEGIQRHGAERALKFLRLRRVTQLENILHAKRCQR
ncbi:hypothetical protein D9M72_546100 [compost metagenome]